MCCVDVMIRWSNRKEVIISTTILQVCAMLQLRSGLLFVMIMTMVMVTVNNEKERKLISHHHHLDNKTISDGGINVDFWIIKVNTSN